MMISGRVTNGRPSATLEKLSIEVENKQQSEEVFLNRHRRKIQKLEPPEEAKGQ
jgi:hypothetical protein